MNAILYLLGVHLYGPTSQWNLWWSGFGSCLTEFAIVAVVWRKVNCHAKGCFRIGLHKVDGTHYITCKKHHPGHPGSRASTAEEIAQAHAVAQAQHATTGGAS